MGNMNIREILQKFQFGNPVAEYDQGLQGYFLVTDTFRYLVGGDADIIAGDKGTGKTAIYQHLKGLYKNTPELNGIEVITGFNPTGEPLFRRLGDEAKMTEGQYITVWKLYFLSLVGNWLIKNSHGENSPALRRLSYLLSKADMVTVDDSAGTVFSRLMSWLRQNASPKAVGMDFTFNEMGYPVLTPKVELGESRKQENIDIEVVPHHDALNTLNDALAEKKVSVWIVMDRLDEAFVGRPDIESLALRALIRTFMDFMSYSRIRLKLFVRKDLFRKITRDGFVNLTHVSARRKEIVWEEEDLFVLLIQRIRSNSEILRSIGLNRSNDRLLFNAVFPPKVYQHSQSPTTWHWLLSQIKDGNGVKAPRNLIDLCIMGQEEQLRLERRNAREFVFGTPIISADALRKAAIRLSNQRIEDTLMAEYGEDVKASIKAFRNGKAEHSEESLAELFGVEVAVARLIANVLCDVGFLEQFGDTYKVPTLYRAGLNITRGKAYK
jgi:hypothetical protein